MGTSHTAPTARQIIIMKRNSLVYISRLVQTAGIALIVATLLIRPTMSQNSVTDGQLVSALPLLLLQSCCLCFWQGHLLRCYFSDFQSSDRPVLLLPPCCRFSCSWLTSTALTLSGVRPCQICNTELRLKTCSMCQCPLACWS